MLAIFPVSIILYNMEFEWITLNGARPVIPFCVFHKRSGTIHMKVMSGSLIMSRQGRSREHT